MANPSPTIVFEINLQTVNRFSWSLPYNTQPVGNETEAEADNFKFTRSTWIPTLNTAPNIAKKEAVQFTMYGMEAVYLKNTYTTGDDPVLRVVSIS